MFHFPWQASFLQVMDWKLSQIWKTPDVMNGYLTLELFLIKKTEHFVRHQLNIYSTQFHAAKPIFAILVQ